MIRIAVISDTHGALGDDIKQHLTECDEVWHAGDIGSVDVLQELKNIKPTIAVYGNIDGREIRSECNAVENIEREGFKILIHHYGGRSGKYDPRAVQLLKTLQPNIFVCGHSHILHVGKEARFHHCLVLNPGAAGFHGFHKVRTMLRFTLDQGKISNMEAIEMKRRILE